MNANPRPRAVRFALFALLASALLPGLAAACMWDYDTIRDERRGLPGIAEVLAGKWEKHSAFFYENRVARMKALIAKEPANWAAYDNLAVALEKLGRPADAVAVMRDKDRLAPGQYTTHANLGTFLLHTGQLDEGIDEIKKALAINPAAHFGREEYQLRLAEFLRDGKADPRLLTSMNFLHIAGGEVVDPKTYLASAQPTTEPDTEPSAELPASASRSRPESRPSTEPATLPADDVEAATRAVQLRHDTVWAIRGGGPAALSALGIRDNVFDGLVGITRFGTGTSAELYLTLGDLLALRGDKSLAYRAYQRAAEFHHPREAYLHAVMGTLEGVIYDKASIAPETIAPERAAADAWVKAYQQYEDDLIRAGKDPDDEANLAGFYAANGPAVTAVSFDPVEDMLPREHTARWLVGALAAVLLLIVIRRVVRRRRRAMASAVETGAGLEKTSLRK